MASAAGIPAVICDGTAAGHAARRGARRGVGTGFAAHPERTPSFKLWLRYAKPARGRVRGRRGRGAGAARARIEPAAGGDHRRRGRVRRRRRGRGLLRRRPGRQGDRQLLGGRAGPDQGHAVGRGSASCCRTPPRRRSTAIISCSHEPARPALQPPLVACARLSRAYFNHAGPARGRAATRVLCRLRAPRVRARRDRRGDRGGRARQRPAAARRLGARLGLRTHGRWTRARRLEPSETAMTIEGGCSHFAGFGRYSLLGDRARTRNGRVVDAARWPADPASFRARPFTGCSTATARRRRGRRDRRLDGAQLVVRRALGLPDAPIALRGETACAGRTFARRFGEMNDQLLVRLRTLGPDPVEVRGGRRALWGRPPRNHRGSWSTPATRPVAGGGAAGPVGELAGKDPPALRNGAGTSAPVCLGRLDAGADRRRSRRGAPVVASVSAPATGRQNDFTADGSGSDGRPARRRARRAPDPAAHPEVGRRPAPVPFGHGDRDQGA